MDSKRTRAALRATHLALLVGLASCASSRPFERSVAMSEVEEVLLRAYRQMGAGELEQLMSLYAEGALIQSPGEAPVDGIPAIREMWRATFARYEVRLVPRVLEATEAGGWLVVRGHAVGTFTR